MEDRRKTKAELIEELRRLRGQVASLEGDEAGGESLSASAEVAANPRSPRVIEALGECTRLFLSTNEEDSVWEGVCKTLVEVGSYRVAWAGVVEGPDNGLFRTVAATGCGVIHGEVVPVDAYTHEKGLCPIARALHTGQLQTCRDLPHDAAFAAWHARAKQHGYSAGAVFPIMTEDGALGTLNLCAAEPGAFGKGEIDLLMVMVGHLSLSIRSIRQRRAATQDHLRLISAIEATNESVVITDTAGAILYVNPAFEMTAGYTREEAIGQNPRILKSGKHDDAFYRTMWKTLVSGAVWHGRFINRRRDGTLFTEEATISPVPGPDGATVNYVAVKRDITEQLALEAQFHQSQKMEAIGRLAGGVAHDFNNLLSAITSNASVALSTLSHGDPLFESIGEIAEAADRGAALTQQLLAFSRRQVIEPKILDLGEQVRNMGALLHRLVGENVAIRTETQPGLWRVKVDAGQIEQILLNLVVNARDAMPNGGDLLVEIANVTLDEAASQHHPEMSPGDYVALTVTDSGLGMTAEIQEKIFEPFFTTKAAGVGTGLGLATVFGLVAHNNGHLEVWSEPEHGAQFTIQFPRARGPISTVRRRTGLPLRGRETILVVEDEDIVRKAALRVLRHLGYTVIEANSGGDAIALMEQHTGPVDLLFTDVVMPNMDGRALAERLRKIRPGLKVLFSSGYTQNIIVHHGVLDEGLNFVPKPYSMNVLARRVREVLDSPDG